MDSIYNMDTVILGCQNLGFALESSSQSPSLVLWIKCSIMQMNIRGNSMKESHEFHENQWENKWNFY